MAAGKSPGEDGLPAEFYKEFFSDIGPILIKIANAQSNRPLARSQRKGIIALLPKKTAIPPFSVTGGRCR
jgi:hypothetical protein